MADGFRYALSLEAIPTLSGDVDPLRRARLDLPGARTVTSSADLLPAGAVELELSLTSGRLSACSFGAEAAPLVMCIPGLSSNQRAFDAIGPVLAEAGHRVVALDLRGRGHSEVTPAGTYGWEAHARDILAAADRLGAQLFDVIGHSMGAFVTLATAGLAPERIRRAVLVDAAGTPEPASLPPIIAGLERLGPVWPSADHHVERCRAAGVCVPWSDQWRRHYAWELTAAPGGGVVTTTNREAVLEDAAYGGEHRATELWTALTMPVLLLRAARPIVPGAGFVLSATDFERFRDAVPGSAGVEVDANHWGVIAHPDSLAAIRDFLA